MISKDELKHFEGWDKVKESSLKEFLKHSRPISLKSNSMIYYEGEDHPYMYLVIKGFVVLNKISVDGNERYLYFLSNGEIFNPYVIDGKKTTTSSKTHTDSDILQIHKNIILDLMKKDFEFNMLIVKAISKLARRTQRQMLNVGTYDTRERIAARLWKLSKDYGLNHEDHIHIDLPLTQSDLSNVIGTSRETVNRTLKELEKEGIIQMEDREIVIRDRDKLIKNLK